MALQTLGEDLLARDAQDRLRTRIATIFPDLGMLVTVPGVHATQRIACVDAINERRAAAGQPLLTEAEQEELWLRGVDLILEEEGVVLIRPDPGDMPMAFAADDLLQQLTSKKKIRFLHVLDPRVRDAIKRRGELWRICPLPRSREQMQQMIRTARIGIGGRDIYYYNKAVGSRILTCQQLEDLGGLCDEELRRHLTEIQQYSARTNRLGRPEVSFFMASSAPLGASFAACDFAGADAGQVRLMHQSLCRAFADAVRPEFREDDIECPQWRSAMFGALIGESEVEVPEEVLLGLSAEFFLQIEWLPGACIEEGELIVDPVFEEEAFECAKSQCICDEKARRFIFNFIRDYGDLEYVNIGRVMGSLSRRRDTRGRRGVYLAEIKQAGSEQPILRIIRLQKWGVREHLDEGKDLLAAIVESEEYTEYIMDRRLGCRQLGMNLPRRVTSRKIDEIYTGTNQKYRGIRIWTPYFEREYVRGEATDKISPGRFADNEFAMRFARVLGRAAAPNLIVGRCGLDGSVTFNDGDELVIEDANGLPVDIIVSDHTGTFVDYHRPLRDMVGQYAGAIQRYGDHVADRPAFYSAFVDAFAGRLVQIQQEYRRRKRAFESLFRHERRDEAGSFAYRWERVLTRLDTSDAGELVGILRGCL